MLLRLFIVILFICITVCPMPATSAVSQNKELSKPIMIGGTDGFDGTNCETIKASFDLIAQAARGHKKIIVIARLGSREVSRKLNKRRLKNLREYLKFTRGISDEQIITAEGEQLNRLGQVDIHIGGELFMIVRLKRNKDFFTGCNT